MEIVRAEIKARLTDAIFADGESAISETIDVFQITDNAFYDGLKQVNEVINVIRMTAHRKIREQENLNIRSEDLNQRRPG